MSKIILNNQTIEYQLNLENRKTVRLSFNNGQLHVFAPKRLPQDKINQILIDYQDKILTYYEQYVPFINYQEGYIYIMGVKTKLKICDMRKNECVLADDCLYVYTKNYEKAINQYLKDYLHFYICMTIEDYLKEDFDFDMPKVEVKKYKSRWGACYYEDNKVSFNTSLIHLSSYYIDYVIVHELTHFLVHDHSSQFYIELEKRMPDYKQRITKFKEVHL